ncbi:MAG: hypothetical protein ACI4S4_07770, partial [Candidatus Ornithospirochaeta sp.]
MQNQNRKSIVILLVVQIGITVFYAFSLFEILFSGYRFSGWEEMKTSIIEYVPHLVILLCLLWPQAALIFKHKLHSQDGEIMPLLFTLTAFQASLIVTDALEAMGYIFVFPEALLVIQRFSLVATAAFFLLASLRYYGFSSSNMGMYSLLFLSLALLLSALVPFSSYHGEMSTLTPGYEVYVQIVVLVLYIITVITFIMTAVKDKT